ncbi:MAG: SRPBCC domain-containing protein [Burkholderiales bacterium]|nr:SRPBCC domain-containing protein [Burkholderiales bacterium]
MSESIIVRVSHKFNAPAERVFDAWLQPAVAKRFFFATPPKGEVVRCDLNAREGGRFSIVDRRPRDHGEPGTHDVEHTGTWLLIDRPGRLSFNFAVPAYSPEVSTVVLDFANLPGGVCEVTLVHDLGNTDTAREYRDKTTQGWGMVLGNLERALQN